MNTGLEPQHGWIRFFNVPSKGVVIEYITPSLLYYLIQPFENKFKLNYIGPLAYSVVADDIGDFSELCQEAVSYIKGVLNVTNNQSIPSKE